MLKDSSVVGVSLASSAVNVLRYEDIGSREAPTRFALNLAPYQVRRDAKQISESALLFHESWCSDNVEQGNAR